MITVLMSVYHGDNAAFVDSALKSIELQSYLPCEVVIVKDGPVNDSINDVIQFYSKRLKVKSFQLDKNYGLSIALNYGLERVTTPWIARFDADDINLPNRFYEQMRVIEDGGVDVFGGHIKEFDFDESKPFARRVVPLEETAIKKSIVKRNPFNHMTVCMRVKVLRENGGYPNNLFMQDYLLWVQLMSKGVRMLNIDRDLVLARVDGNRFYKRRFSRSVVISEILLRKEMIKKDVGGPIENLFYGINRMFFLSIPIVFRKMMYRHLLRVRAR